MKVTNRKMGRITAALSMLYGITGNLKRDDADRVIAAVSLLCETLRLREERKPRRAHKHARKAHRKARPARKGSK